MDIGTVEPLLLDVLINALTQISSEYDLHFILLNNYFGSVMYYRNSMDQRESLTKAI